MKLKNGTIPKDISSVNPKDVSFPVTITVRIIYQIRFLRPFVLILCIIAPLTRFWYGFEGMID